MRESRGVLGPPWTQIGDPRAVLLVDPPRVVACEAVAAFSPERRTLRRFRSIGAARRSATAEVRRGGSAVVLKGAIQLRSGSWLWPVVSEGAAVAKADDPLTRRGFIRTVGDLFDYLLREATDVERAALEAGISELRRQRWGDMGSEEVTAALDRLADMVRGVPLRERFRERVGGRLVTVTEDVARRSKLVAPVQPVLTADQSEIARGIGSDAVTFVTDEYGRRAAELNLEARAVIARGAELGLGRDEIAGRLEDVLGRRLSGRSRSYYLVVASSAVGRARSFGQVAGYAEAGIAMYQWASVLDQGTCEICRFLHGQVFPVDNAARAFERARGRQDPEAALREFTWYRLVGGETGEDGLRRGGDIFVAPRGGPLGPRVATVERSAVGSQDRRGTFRQHISPLAAGGTVVPPAHGRCRCTTLPA